MEKIVLRFTENFCDFVLKLIDLYLNKKKLINKLFYKKTFILV